MSGHKSVKDLPEGGEKFDSGKVAMLKLALGGVGGVCLLATLVMLIFFSDGVGRLVSYSYLFAFIFFFTIGVGGLFWTILHHATNSGWGTVVRRQMENIAGLIPALFILAIPFLIPGVRDNLWEWNKEARELKAQVEDSVDEKAGKIMASFEETRESLKAEVKRLESLLGEMKSPGNKAAIQIQHDNVLKDLELVNKEAPASAAVAEHEALKKLMYHEKPLLTHKWFGYFNWSYLRLFLYAVIFIGMVYLLRDWSFKSDKTGNDRYFKRSRYWSCFFILPFGVGFTFLVIDFLMTLNYEWFSTMWGVYLFAGAALNSMAVLILVVTFLRKKDYLKEVVSMEHYHLMGKLMFAFVVFWAYIAFSQYFLIWYANITEETRFYLLRNTGGWNIASLILVFGHFVVPFVVLLWRPLKKRPELLALAALWNLGMHVLDIYWIVIAERGPSLSTMGHQAAELWQGGAGVVFLDILAFVGVGGTLAFVFLHLLSRSSLYPCGDPRLEESVNVVN